MTNERRVLGEQAELRVLGEFSGAGWLTRQSADLDYARKADVEAVCSGRAAPFLVQVSLGDKSVGERERLDARGVRSLSIAALDGSGMTAPEYACENWCDRVFCADQQTPLIVPPPTLK